MLKKKMGLKPRRPKKLKNLCKLLRGVLHTLAQQKGESYIDTAIFCFIATMVLAFITYTVPVFFTKLTLDNYAHELIREAEISGRIGTETTNRLTRLNEIKGLNPNVNWSRSGQVQIGQEITVTVSRTVDMGFFTFGSFPVQIVSEATGVSEVLWK